MLRGKARMPVTFALVSVAGLAVWKVYLSAQANKVDVLALVTQHGNNSDAAYWDAQVRQP
jgi:hypothetical protein